MLHKKRNRVVVGITGFFICLGFMLSCNPSDNKIKTQEKDGQKADLYLNKGSYLLDEDTETPRYDSAVFYLEKASALGNSDADRILAEQYFFGYKIKADTGKAHEYIKRGIEKGDSAIYIVLAKVNYYKGNINETIKYLIKGDIKYSGYELSQILLLGYAFGQPEPVYKDKINEQEGLKYLMKSAENDNLQAQQDLVYYYLKGIDNALKPDTAKAKHYYDAILNNPEAKETPGIADELEELEKKFNK